MKTMDRFLSNDIATKNNTTLRYYA